MATLATEAATGGFRLVAPLHVARRSHCATLLADGRVLVVGGVADQEALGSCALWDSSTESWREVASLAYPRWGHQIVVLPDGRVLAIGGRNAVSPVAPVELWDPIREVWTTLPPLQEPREQHTATALPDGRVLVAGGLCADGSTSARSELWSPRSLTWSDTESLALGRWGHSATLLADGRVLVAGGAESGAFFGKILREAEIWDVATETWQQTPDLNNERFGHRAVLLTSGQVLLIGGDMMRGRHEGCLSACELWSPGSAPWHATGRMGHGRGAHTATVLSDGRVLVTGGHNGGRWLSSSELWSPATGTWMRGADLHQRRLGHTATLLRDGRLLVVGGWTPADTVPLASVELWELFGA